jgi:hypothetical protein
MLASAVRGQKGQPVESDKAKELLLIQRAEKGDRQAQSEIVHKAELGDRQAETALGDNYEYGIWVRKDHDQAVNWYRKAAEHGDPGARYILGEMYFDGQGMPQDFAKAAHWFGCPKPSETILSNCKAVTYEDLPPQARSLLRRMKCEVTSGSNYNYGTAIDLRGNGIPVYQFCCSEAPHGPCGAALIGEVDGRWKDLTAKEGLEGFDSTCGGLVVLESQSDGFHDVCLPNQCDPATARRGNGCSTPEVWQFQKDRYHPVEIDPANPKH